MLKGTKSHQIKYITSYQSIAKTMKTKGNYPMSFHFICATSPYIAIVGFQQTNSDISVFYDLQQIGLQFLNLSCVHQRIFGHSHSHITLKSIFQNKAKANLIQSKNFDYPL
jgi:hypothetical protein